MKWRIWSSGITDFRRVGARKNTRPNTSADGKGIEINTSYLRYKLPDWTLSREIVDLYFKLGGMKIPVGSDAHTNEWIGRHIRETQEELLKLRKSDLGLE